MTAREKAKMRIYRAGVMARCLDHPANPPGDLSWEDRHWWLGGWNDRDAEMR
ncbi:MAG: hypothetical protein ACRCXB_28560 [Aeromonadaceae bacterium]